MSKIPKTEFVGLYVSEEDDNCLRLQALMLEKSKSDLVRTIIKDYIFEKNLSIQSLIDRYAKYVYNEWNLRLRDEIKYEEHLRMVMAKLMAKSSIPTEIIDRIIDACKEENLTV